ncbi:MAG: sterol desaturase family protein [Acidobacteria bacterium]|nr:sterol desaturase family protein [Acidobacteriota bacterium]
MAQVVDWFQIAGGAILRNVRLVLAYPFNPDERIYLPYLLTSLVAAVGVYLVTRQTLSGTARQRLDQFLFPHEVWRTTSAWLDVRYFFVHQVLRVFLYGTFAAAATTWTFRVTAQLLGLTALGEVTPRPTSWGIEIGYAFVAIALLDFVAFAIHWCQHHVPLLWEFHKVHHSARVMHPLTNYREHPIDNLVYASGLSLCAGVTMAVVFALLGYVPRTPTIGGAGVFAVAFNGLAYNLRHSHIWLRWPGALVYLFGSPAHHQVHHSYHPTHINRNFAFMFPVWDLLFGTFRMPSTNADVKFDLGETGDEELTTVARLYWIPFRDAARLLRNRSHN